jgi:hypothetical protein
MPCFDGRDDDYTRISYTRSNELQRKEEELKLVEAMLCAICSALETKPELKGRDRLQPLLDQIDWAEAGVPRAEFMRWWTHHKIIDMKRRKREADKQRENQARVRVLAKLTPEERKLLKL